MRGVGLRFIEVTFFLEKSEFLAEKALILERADTEIDFADKFIRRGGIRSKIVEQGVDGRPVLLVRKSPVSLEIHHQTRSHRMPH